MITGLDREEFEQKARDTVADFLRQPRAERIGKRLPLVILIEACLAAVAEHSPAGESVETLMDKLSPHFSRALHQGFDAVNAKRGYEVGQKHPFIVVME